MCVKILISCITKAKSFMTKKNGNDGCNICTKRWLSNQGLWVLMCLDYDLLYGRRY